MSNKHIIDALCADWTKVGKRRSQKIRTFTRKKFRRGESGYLPDQYKANAYLNIVYKFREYRHIQTGITRRRISNTMQLARQIWT